jgi:hypothetical protein
MSSAVAIVGRSRATSDLVTKRLLSMLKKQALAGNVAAAEALIRLRLVTEGLREPDSNLENQDAESNR